MKKEYRLIPMSEITEGAKAIAVAWVENYTPNGSIMPEIAQKHKLASDIQNYAYTLNRELLEENKRLTEALKYAHNKAYILFHTKNAVSKQCRRDAEKLFHSLEKALLSESSKEDKNDTSRKDN
jgi:uncharacterized protein YecE (DUF72 family)